MSLERGRKQKWPKSGVRMALGFPNDMPEKLSKGAQEVVKKKVLAKSGTISKQILLGLLTNRGGGLRLPRPLLALYLSKA